MDAEKRILNFALAQLRRREFLKLAALSAGASTSLSRASSTFSMPSPTCC